MHGFTKRIGFGLALAAALSLVACGGSDGPAPQQPDEEITTPDTPSTPAASISVSPDGARDFWGYTAQLKAQVRDAKGAVDTKAVPKWTSSDPNVATVNQDGLVTLNNPGEAKITASVGSATSNESTITVRGFSDQLAVNKQDNCVTDDTETEIYCWGDGYPITENRSDLALQLEYPNAVKLHPGEIPDGAHIVQVLPGFQFSCALIDTGEAYCWNGSLKEQSADRIGTGSKLPIGEPSLVVQGERPVGVGFTKLAASLRSEGKCGLGDDSQVYCWGWQPSIPERDLFVETPELSEMLTKPKQLEIALPVGESIVDLAGTVNWLCVLSSSGLPHCWSANSRSFEPLARGELPSNVKLRSIETGSTDFFSGLGDDGWVYNWGGGFGRLYGAGSNEFVGGGGEARILRRLGQGQVPQGVTFTDVGPGSLSGGFCAVGTDGQAYCWSRGYNGSLGDGILAEHDALTPVKVVQGEVPSGVEFTTIRCGTYHCTAIADDSKAYAWGWSEGAATGHPLSSGLSAEPRLISRVGPH